MSLAHTKTQNLEIRVRRNRSCSPDAGWHGVKIFQGLLKRSNAIVRIHLQCRKPQFNSYVGKICRGREGIGSPLQYSWASPVAQQVKNLPVMWRPGFHPWVGKILWRREYPLQYSGLENFLDCIVHAQRVEHDWMTFTFLVELKEHKSIREIQNRSQQMLEPKLKFKTVSVERKNPGFIPELHWNTFTLT